MIRRSLSRRHWRRAAAIAGMALTLQGGAARGQSGGPITIPNTQYQPLAWSEIEGWAEDDHAAAFAAFLKSCRPVVRSVAPPEDAPSLQDARREVCRRAMREGMLDAARS